VATRLRDPAPPESSELGPTHFGAGAAHDAFISYSRRDKAFSAKLEEALERYKPPKDLNLPQRHLRVFRDESDFTGVDYWNSVEEHLKDSECLIVVCSPHARNSDFVNDEIRRFAATRGVGRVLPILLSGTPNNEVEPGQENAAAFPQALCDLMAMPLAINYVGFDPGRDKFRGRAFDDSWFTLLANIYGLSRAEIEHREKKRRARVRRIASAITGGVILALSAALIVSILSRQEAIEQRRIAEAREQTALARQLGVQSEAVLAGRTGAIFAEGGATRLAAQLAVESLTRHPTLEGDQALRAALPALPRVVRKSFLEISRPILSGDGRYLAGLSPDREPVILEIRTGNEEARLPVEGTGILALSRDASFIAVATREGIEVWRKSAPEEIKRIAKIGNGVPDSHRSAVSSLAISSDGKNLVAARSGSLEVWEVASASRIATIPESGGDLTISPDGRHLASISVVIGPAFKKGTVSVWEDWPTDEPRQVLDASGYRVKFSADSRYLIAADSEGGASVWTTSDLSPAGGFPPPDRSENTVFGTPMHDLLAISSDGRYLATNRAGAIFVWEDWRSQNPLEIARIDGVVQPGANALAFTGPDDHSLVKARAGNGGVELLIWEVLGALEVSRIDGSEIFSKLLFDPSGLLLATLTSKELGQIWNWESGRPIGVPFEDIADLALSPDGRYLATASGSCIRLWQGWETSNPQGAACLTPETKGELSKVAFGADGAYLAASTFNPSGVQVWDIENRRQVAIYEGASSATFSRESDTIAIRTQRGLEVGSLNGERRLVDGAAFGIEALSPDGRYLAHAGIIGSALQVLDLEAAGPARSLIHEQPGLAAFDFGPHGRYLATASNDWQGGGAAQVWDLEADRQVARVTHGRRGLHPRRPTGRQRLCSPAKQALDVRLRVAR